MKNCLQSLLMALVLFGLTGCSIDDPSACSEPIGLDEYMRGRTDGEVVYAESNRLVVTAFPTRIVYQGVGEARSIDFEVLVENNSDTPLQDFHWVLEPDQDLAPYLAAGAAWMPEPVDISFGPQDLPSKGETDGLLPIVAGFPLRHASLPASALVEKAMAHGQTYSLRLTWADGEETLHIAAPVIDIAQEG